MVQNARMHQAPHQGFFGDDRLTLFENAIPYGINGRDFLLCLCHPDLHPVMLDLNRYQIRVLGCKFNPNLGKT